jgi:hypothetical protein
MPNWVTTDVTVYADSIIELEAFINSATAGYHVKAGDADLAKENHGMLLDAQVLGKDTFSFGALTGVEDDFAHNWYNWSIANWGTKWDVSGDASRDLLMASLKENEVNNTDTHQYRISFSIASAWSFPSQAWTTISTYFPNLIFSFSAIEEAHFFIMAGAVKNGQWEESVIDPERFWNDLVEVYNLADKDPESPDHEDNIQMEYQDLIYQWLDKVETIQYYNARHGKTKSTVKES